MAGQTEHFYTQKLYDRLEKGGTFIPQHFQRHLDTVSTSLAWLTWENILDSSKEMQIKEETFNDTHDFLQFQKVQKNGSVQMRKKTLRFKKIIIR